jgi:hypothetical protein
VSVTAVPSSAVQRSAPVAVSTAATWPVSVPTTAVLPSLVSTGAVAVVPGSWRDHVGQRNWMS